MLRVVCWVLNQSGWDVARTTANGLWQQSAKVSEHEAKPGDLVFFEGTYDTPGASHVGLYVGDGMMIRRETPSNTRISTQVIGTNTCWFWQDSQVKGRCTMSEKLEKLRADLARARERRIQLNNRIELLERRIAEAEKVEVAEMVRVANLTPEQLLPCCSRMPTPPRIPPR